MSNKIFFAIISAVIFSVAQAQLLSDMCIECTSSLILPECINPIAAGLTPKQCTGGASNPSCFSMIDQEGNVVRGCVNQLVNMTSTECDSETCQVCAGLDMPNQGRQGCNNQLFPEHRLWCITCTGGANSTCAGNTTLTTSVCPLFSSEDQCYVARPNGNYERGCISSPNSCRDGVACHRCSGQGCNYVDFSSAIAIFSDMKMIGLIVASVVFAILK